MQKPKYGKNYTCTTNKYIQISMIRQSYRILKVTSTSKMSNKNKPNYFYKSSFKVKKKKVLQFG